MAKKYIIFNIFIEFPNKTNVTTNDTEKLSTRSMPDALYALLARIRVQSGFPGFDELEETTSAKTVFCDPETKITSIQFSHARNTSSNEKRTLIERQLTHL